MDRDRPQSIRAGTAAAFVANVGGVLIGVGVSAVIARSLGPTGKGSYDLAIATAGLLGLGFGLSLPGGIAYAVARRAADPARLRPVLIATAACQVMLSLAVLALGMSAAPSLFGHLTMSTALAISAIAGLTSLALNLRAELVGLQRIGTASVLDIAGRVLGAGAITGVLWIGRFLGDEPGFEALLWATATAALALCLLFWINLPAARPGAVERGVRPILGFAIPAHLGNLVQFLNYRLDLFLVSAFAGIAAVGIYALAVSFAQIVWLAPGALALTVLPRVASETEAGQSATDLPRLARVSLAISVVIAVGIGLAAPPFMQFVFGSAFAPSGAQLLWLLPGVAVFGQANVLAAYIGGIGRQRLNLYVSLAALVATLAFDFALIPSLAGLGAAIASTLSYSVTAVLTVAVTARLGAFRIGELMIPRRSDLVLVFRAIGELVAALRFVRGPRVTEESGLPAFERSRDRSGEDLEVEPK
ncbi:MAG TPA: polysaccharide biosynthesis C-terminal domain-containing protein [Candidatus Limnocylindrales bacterium]|nr:polysaccharide biosynthesis C-terminal domain-containing protein [Candidatus Limnocylindrales bacterium]